MGASHATVLGAEFAEAKLLRFVHMSGYCPKLNPAGFSTGM
jgi:hypothetical protein